MDEVLSSQVYYVDEAGDSTIFSKKGKILIGSEGCSRFFTLGLLQVGDPLSLKTELDQLRDNLMADPYFKGVPSMQPEAKKTALAFHAKDDLPEVRREVFALLRSRNDLGFYAVVSDKFSTLAYVQNRQAHDQAYHYKPDETYDFLIRRLFKQRLHQSDNYQIVFARRGNRARNKILREQLEIARQRFEKRPEIPPNLQVESGYPKNHAGLQATDYFLWALQRLYERQEDRYLFPIWSQCKLIIDIHDNRRHGYGEYYNRTNPLTKESLEGRI